MPRGVERFTAFAPSRREEYFQNLRDGNSRFVSARNVGVSRELVRQYRNAHADFEQEERAAEDEATDRVENALHAAALSGNVTACQVWLYNRRPSRWKDQRNLKVFVGDDDLDSAIERELERVARGGQAADAGAPEAQNGDGD